MAEQHWVQHAISHGTELTAKAARTRSPAPAETGSLRVTHELGHHVTLSQADGRPLLGYRYGDGFHMPYWYPVCTPSGRSIGIFSPHDHPWHRGLWMVWKYVNTVNFWEGPFDTHPDRGHGLQRHRTFEQLDLVDGSVQVRSINDWVTSTDKHLLEEHRSWTVSAPAAGASWYVADLTFEFRAVANAVLIESTSIKQFSWGGYGGLVLRSVRDMASHPEGLINSTGAAGDEKVHGAFANWCASCGPLDGTLTREWAGFAITGHPSNPVHPVPFHAASQGIGAVGTAPTRYEPLRITKRRPLTFRHRVVIYDGKTDVRLIRRLYREYIGLLPGARHEER